MRSAPRLKYGLSFLLIVTLSFVSLPAVVVLSAVPSVLLLSAASLPDTSTLETVSVCVAVSVANTAGFIVNSVTAASTLHTILFAFFFINLIIFPPIYCSISYEIVKLLPSKLTSAMLPHTTGIIGDI